MKITPDDKELKAYRELKRKQHLSALRTNKMRTKEERSASAKKAYKKIHVAGSHGAIFFAGRLKDICAECNKPVKRKV